MAHKAPSTVDVVTPSGIQISYYDKAHRYKIGRPALKGASTVDGSMRFVPSASGILDALPKALTGWGEGLGVKGALDVIVDAWAENGREPATWTVPQLLEAMKRANLRWWQVREVAAIQGTDVHEVFEQLSLGRPPRMSEIPLEKRGFVQAICRFWAERDPHVYHAELMVASWEHQFAGRMDLLASLDDDGPAVIDLKTSKKIRESHHFQTAGYQIGVSESGYGPCSEGYVLRVGADGKYELVKSWAKPEWFLALKGSYEVIKASEKARKEQAA